MPFEPDIVVTGRDFPSVELVVEVKLRPTDRQAAEAQLKRYMLSMRCPVGVLVTGSVIAIFRDRLTGYTEQSIESVGSYPLSGIPEVEPTLGSPSDPKQAIRFEQSVQMWLDHLARQRDTSGLPAGLREAIEEYVLPALANGEVRAGVPRHSRTGSDG